MPTFDTPNPIALDIDLAVGDIQILAAERPDTVVAVRPTDPAKKADVAAAEHTRVEYADGRLTVRGPRGWRHFGLRGSAESVDVEIGLPAGSDVDSSTGMATVRASGRLGECRVKTGVGEIRIAAAGPAQLKAGAGDITVEAIAGDADVATGSGTVRIGSIDGSARIRNAGGDSWIGDIAGDLRVSSASGRISVDRAQATVAAKTAAGDLRLGEVVRGAVVAQTGTGKLDIAIRPGVPAWLDLKTHMGRVHNDLDDAARPQAGEDAVEVQARSGVGDITITRAAA